MVQKVQRFVVYPASHYVTPRDEIVRAITSIKAELKVREAELLKDNLLVEAQRLEQRTNFDLEMLDQWGSARNRKLFPPPDWACSRGRAALPH